jgi:hypothetical protein
MSNNRIPNHRIDSLVADLAPFSNYNASITAYRVTSAGHSHLKADRDPNGTVYTVQNWRTIIAEIDTETREIIGLRHDYISQTTSRLVGRILRALPPESVERYLTDLATIRPTDAKRLARMAGIA